MTDDIVTRLRNIASLRGDMSGHVIPLACIEAAHEIEYLQKIIIDFVQAEQEYQDACNQSDEVYLEDKWKKAWNVLYSEASKYNL